MIDRRLVAVLIVGALALPYALLLAPPPHTTSGVVQIMSGASIGETAAALHERGAILSPFAFKVLASLFGGVQAGAYALEGEGALVLAYRMTHGITGLSSERVTIPEGTTIVEMEQLFGVDLPNDKEGYLFPDTYDFLPGTSAEQIVARMHARYEEKIAPLRALIETSGHTEAEIIIMASILEKEARQPETMRVVSGILWDRIKIGMALQVDAVFGYIKGVPTYHPSGEDLDIDSPYNTYKYRGLPPGPIGAPGLNAIEAAINPTESPYLYYLTGTDGTMHYARTFEEHIANRKYLR